MSAPDRPLDPILSRSSWVGRMAAFLGVAIASAGITFFALSHVGPARAIPSAVPIGIVAVLPAEPAPAPILPPPPRRVAVDSLAEGFRPEAASLRDLRVGWIDSLRANEDGAVLHVSGWAGDPEFGLRTPYVGVGACGVLVAVVAVAGERPDVRDNVHPNLDRSGWSARLFAGHLPDCESRRIEAYALLPGGRILAKLASVQVEPPALAAAGVQADGPAALLRPGDLPGPELARARVARPHQALRRCAGEGCAETARLPRGEHSLAILDRRDGWALVSLPGSGRAGWLPEREVERAPERLAQR